jgi:hypothetical protein
MRIESGVSRVPGDLLGSVLVVLESISVYFGTWDNLGRTSAPKGQ